jgi:hypothetical protein
MILYRSIYSNGKRRFYDIGVIVVFFASILPLIVVLIKIYAIRTSSPIYWGMKGMPLIYSFFTSIGNNIFAYTLSILILIGLGIYVMYINDKLNAITMIMFLVFGIFIF